MNQNILLQSKQILFFDGNCLLCNRIVRLLNKIDKKNKIYYAPLGGTTFQNLTITNKPHAVDSVIFYKNGQFFSAWDAVYQLFKLLDFPYKTIIIFNIFPKSLLNQCYFIVANNRIRWFGRATHCQMPSNKLAKKLLP